MEQVYSEPLRRANEEAREITRASLRTALLYLMSEQDFCEITVTDLARRAGVSRSAFYRNYTGKEQILEEIRLRFFLVEVAMLQSEEYHRDPQAYYCRLFTSMKEENARVIQAIFRARTPDGVPLYMNRAMEKLYPPGGAAERYQMRMYQAALSMLIVEWVENAMEESPEWMSSLCMHCFHEEKWIPT